MQRYQREHFWNAIVWPLLWPLLLLQAALVVLCLVVGALGFVRKVGSQAAVYACYAYHRPKAAC